MPRVGCQPTTPVFELNRTDHDQAARGCDRQLNGDESRKETGAIALVGTAHTGGKNSVARSSQANYTDRTTAAVGEASSDFCW
jgi:hypothetical protein